MPQITDVSIHSFSSEDPNFPANNLIETKVTKKWKCEKIGEKSAFVILKLDKPYTITQIDIGNEYSAVVEILVGNSLQSPPNFKEIMLATSLMTIFEAKNERNPNRVRMFNKEIFNPTVADQKWDLVKVICSQTFNNHKQFGLSFINLHTSDEVSSKNNEDSPVKSTTATSQHVSARNPSTPVFTPKPGKKIGKFRFRDSSSDDEEVSPFAQWKNKKDNTQKSDSKPSNKEQTNSKPDSDNSNKRKRSDDDDDKKTVANKDRNRSKGLFYESSDDEPNEKLQRKIEKDKKSKTFDRNSQKFSPKSTPVKPSSSSSKFYSFISDDIPSSSDVANKSTRNDKSTSHSQNKSPSHSKKEFKYKAFNKLLEGVTFVISGYQNPERGTLRQKALDMGAKYKGDWDNTCTHLICAYSNTPKYNQVKGKGKIVSKNWIESCFSDQKMIPWRRHALDNSERNKAESEDEILCEWNKPKPLNAVDEANDDKTKINRNDSDDSDGDMLVVDRRLKKDDAKIVIDDSDDDMLTVNKANNDKRNVDIDENKSIQKNLSQVTLCDDSIDEKNNEKDNMDTPEIDIYDEDSVSSVDITTIECQAFKDKIFYMNKDLSATDVIKLRDNIKNMLGSITKNPHKANYIITKQGKNLPSSTVKGEIVKEIWIRECFELQAFIPTTRYKL